MKIWFDVNGESLEECCSEFASKRVPGTVFDSVIGDELFVVDLGSFAGLRVDGVEFVVSFVDARMFCGLHVPPL